MLKERYWAVRIGKPKKHIPYLMVHPDNVSSPALFTTRAAALDAALRRYGFTEEVEIDGFGEVLNGFRWDKTPNDKLTHR